MGGRNMGGCYLYKKQYMNEVEFSLIAGMAIGLVVGLFVGWGAGKNRTRRLLSFLSNKMEQLRMDSKLKVNRRDIANYYGDTQRADELTKELAAESCIFYDIQRAISNWCAANNEKDPFTL